MTAISANRSRGANNGKTRVTLHKINKLNTEVGGHDTTHPQANIPTRGHAITAQICHKDQQ